MCMQDIDIDRQIKTNVYFSQATVQIPPNGNRLAVRISCQGNEEGALTATYPVRSGAAAFPNPILAHVARDFAGSGIDTRMSTLADTVTLADVGDVLKGSLQLISTVGAGVWAIETYLDVVSPRPADATKIPE